MKEKISSALFILYLAVLGSYCGLELNSFAENSPFWQINTLVLFLNVFFILLLPPLFYAFCMRFRIIRENRFIRTIAFALNSFFIHLIILLAVYRSVRHMDFDYNFFRYNISVAWSVLWKLFAHWLIVIFLSLSALTVWQGIVFDPAVRILKKISKRKRLILGTAIVAGILCQCFTIQSIRGSATGFLDTGFLSEKYLKMEYRNLYEVHLRKLQTEGIQGTENADASKLGDMIIMVQQESLNGLLLKPEITPQLLKASQNGILFDHFYGNSIQSERGYECILCGVPPSLAGELVEEYPIEDIQKISCLPRLFKALGYTPIVFYSGNPNPRAIRLFEAIGFEKILADDITQPGDVMYDWGYREDIWFTRVDDYIQKNLLNQKVFIFITASATNHTPFKVLDPKFRDLVPYPQPKKSEENLANTTYVQDAYFGQLYDLYREHYADKATLIAISDHSWPIPIHKYNIYNERGAYEENFRIAMLLIPPNNRREFAVGTTVTERFSQIDILPTLLDLTGVKQDYWLGESFALWLLADPTLERIGPRKTKISIQPYGGGFISALRYPKKYLFDVLGKNVKVYDLQNDPEEQSPVIHDIDRHLSLIRGFFENKIDPQNIEFHSAE